MRLPLALGCISFCLLSTAAVGRSAAAPPEAPGVAAPLGVAVAPGGTILSVTCADGRTIGLDARAADGTTTHRDVLLPGLPGTTRIVDVRVTPFGWRKDRPKVALGLALRTEGTKGREYRYAVEADDPSAGAAWRLSDPVLEEAGEPWRIAELRWNAADGDTLEMLFVRGFSSPRVGGDRSPGVEARLFVDVCPFGGPVGIRGKDHLIALKPVK